MICADLLNSMHINAASQQFHLPSLLHHIVQTLYYGILRVHLAVAFLELTSFCTLATMHIESACEWKQKPEYSSCWLCLTCLKCF